MKKWLYVSLAGISLLSVLIFHFAVVPAAYCRKVDGTYGELFGPVSYFRNYIYILGALGFAIFLFLYLREIIIQKEDRNIDAILFQETARLKNITYEQLLNMPDCSAWEITTCSKRYSIELQINRQLEDIIRVMLEVSAPCRIPFFYSGKAVYWGKNSMNELLESDDMIY